MIRANTTNNIILFDTIFLACSDSADRLRAIYALSLVSKNSSLG